MHVYCKNKKHTIAFYEKESGLFMCVVIYCKL
jgi:hypothetical protein